MILDVKKLFIGCSKMDSNSNQLRKTICLKKLPVEFRNEFITDAEDSQHGQ